MEFDSRIKDKYKIFTPFNSEKARDYLSKNGYFSNDAEKFSNLENLKFAVLGSVTNTASPFKEFKGSSWAFFLPAEFTEVIEKHEIHLTPLTLEEFNKIFSIGSVITIRDLKSDILMSAIYNGYGNHGKFKWVSFGSVKYDMFELCEHYEYLDKGQNWKKIAK